MTPKQAMREKQETIRKKLIESLGGKCIRCGFSDWRALQVDHINDDGHLETEISSSGYRVRKNNTRMLLNRVEKEAKQEIKTLQLLCANCNSIKRHEKLEELRKLPGYIYRNLWKGSQKVQ